MRRPRLAGVRMIVFGIVGGAVMVLVTLALWDALMPDIFGLPSISFWQALGLLILSRILFGRMGGGWGHRMRRARLARGWSDLTPEEQQRFRCAMGKSDEGKAEA